MKAYITCPISHTSERVDLLHEIKSIADSENIDSFVFQVGGTPTEIFKRDYAQLKSCDIIIAEVSETSHGVGIEIGMSYCLGLIRILLLETGKYVSKLAEGIPDTYLIEYLDLNDLKTKLTSTLQQIKQAQ